MRDGVPPALAQRGAGAPRFARVDQPKSFLLSPELHRYVLEHGQQPDEVQRSLIESTLALGPLAQMQVAPEQGALLELLVRVTGARRVVEIGTFTGYSALSMARGLPDGGSLLCCDVSEEWTDIGRRHWELAGVADRIELRLGPAIETLRALPADERFDLAFVDADKVSYQAYVDELHPRLRTGGLVLVDNTLWSGAVLDDADHTPDTEAIRAFNDAVAADDRWDTVLVPVADGLTFLRRRED